MALSPHVADPNRKQQLKEIKEGNYHGNGDTEYANRAVAHDKRVTDLEGKIKVLEEVNTKLRAELTEAKKQLEAKK